MLFHFEKDRETGVLTLEGDLTIDRAGELKKALSDSQKRKVSGVTVKLCDVSEVDLTCFQILCSAHKAFDAGNKLLTLSPGASETFRKAKARCGFTRERACGLTLNTACLWKETEASCQKRS
jgi:anti-anti-sigma regulatory factor